jgi:hypothetical protein
MKRRMILFSGLLIVMVGLAFIMPAIAQLRDTGALPAVGVCLLFLGVLLTLGGGGALFYGAKRIGA